MSTYLYIYESRDRREVYIGIADNMSRVWEPHNLDAEAVRDSPGARILQTAEPFSTREAARKAEAIAIYLATRAGRTVHHLDETGEQEDLGTVEVNEGGLTVTNRAGTKSTAVLAPAVLYRPGMEVNYSELERTAIVRIRPDSIDHRPSPFGGLSGAKFAERAQKWWGLKEASLTARPVRRLVAVLSGPQIVLGSWELCAPWFVEEPGGWRFELEDADKDNVLDLKGRTLRFDVPYGLRNLGYSLDLR